VEGSEQPGQPDAPQVSEEEAARAANLLDIRRIIGGVLLVYGLLIAGAGIFGSSADKHQAAGVNVNLYAGIAILVGGVLFLAWAFWRPFTEIEEGEEGPGSGRLRRAPGT
jgi:cytochrome c biogenesis protein CcdA